MKIKARTITCSDVEDELGTSNSDKRGNELVEENDLEEPNHMKAKWMRR